MLGLLFVAGILVTCQCQVKIKSAAGPFEKAGGNAWCPNRRLLFFADDKNLVSYNPEDNKINTISLHQSISTVAPGEKENVLVVGLINGTLVKVEWDGNSEAPDSVVVLAPIETLDEQDLLGDLKPASNGFMYIGFFHLPGPKQPSDHGAIFSYDASDDGEPELQEAGYRAVTGIAINDDDNIICFTDANNYNIHWATYDVDSGNLNKPQKLIDFGKGVGDPVSIVYDTNNHLWVTLFNNSQIAQVDVKRGKILNFIDLPVKYPDALAFGGDNLDTLYVTTKTGFGPFPKDTSELAGHLLAIKLDGVVGKPVALASTN